MQRQSQLSVKLLTYKNALKGRSGHVHTLVITKWFITTLKPSNIIMFAMCSDRTVVMAVDLVYDISSYNIITIAHKVTQCIFSHFGFKLTNR